MNTDSQLQWSAEVNGGSRSLKRGVQRQAWHCERCGSEGVVEHELDAGVYQVLCAIQSDHKGKSPKCPDHLKIRVPLNKKVRHAGPVA